MYSLEDINIDDIIDISLNAGEQILKIYKQDFEVEYKEDNSPLTIADKVSNELICNSLNKLYPNIPIMSEENAQTSYDIRKNWDYYFCVDPIDGTKEFIKKNDEWTVNIALMHKDTPILGVVLVPALNKIYYAKRNSGAFTGEIVDGKVENMQKLPIARDDNTLVVVASKSHLSNETKDFIEGLDKKNKELIIVSKGSSLKLCMVADGSADIYPRLAPTMEWDSAAADAIVREVGKMTYNYETNEKLIYNKENLLNPWFVVR